MAKRTFRTSGADSWNQPKAFQDPCMRRIKHGRVLPMKQPGLLARLFGRAEI